MKGSARVLTWLVCGLTTGLVAESCLAQGGAAGVSGSPIQVALDVSFVEALKNRATITDVPLLIDKVHSKPNAPASDGDLHVAARSPAKVGLPLVAELMNAGLRADVVGQLQAEAGTGTALNVAGVWRIWPEHGGLDPQVQGDDFPAATTTNPQHVFEIHPLTRVGTQDVTETLGPIQQLNYKSGFDYKGAADAFHRYENAGFGLECSKDKNPAKGQHTLYRKRVGYTYVDILSPDDHEMQVHRRRVWFVKGSHAYAQAVAAHAGTRMQVVGIPRVDLALVSWRCAHRVDHPEAMQWGLPYEMVALGILDDQT